MESKSNFKVLGLMSGTSLDGLDLAFCKFTKKASGWTYSIEQAEVKRYPAAWKQKLSQAQLLPSQELLALDVEYGRFLGQACRDFVSKHSVKPHFIASHGHTIFHQPARGFTFQLGNGNALYAASGIPVIYDFRSLDVTLGGQGAPLVPAGDKFLFSDYGICLNLGGIANLSMDIKNKRTAYDVCFCNMSLNYLMEKTGAAYDKDGALAESGEVNTTLLKAFDKVYAGLRSKRPSLGREIFENKIKPLLDNEKIPLADRLRTSVESSAQEIAIAVKSVKSTEVLCTGGGAFNAFFMTRLLEHTADDALLIRPEDTVVKFKEALVFAFLGVLRARGEVNCLKSVTGASKDCSGGILVGF